MIKKGIFWFSTDLRLDDNRALSYAASKMDQLIFVFCPEESIRLTNFQTGRSISNNRQQFLNQSLADLQKKYEVKI